MNAPTSPSRFFAALRAARPLRLVVLLALAVFVGLLSDWLRDDQRLIFPRPLPPLVTTPAQP